MPNLQSSMIGSGSRREYEWLATEDTLDDLLRLCPELILEKYLAVTSLDSGPLYLKDKEIASGWERRLDIAYSPKIADVSSLPHDVFDEWYVFDGPCDLGGLAPPGNNIFEEPMIQGRVHPFVNFGGFSLSAPEYQPLADLFWQQLAWIHPESYIADGDSLTIVSRNRSLFTAARLALTGSI